MKRAVLYARVSSLKQKEEQTIESQLSELKHQIERDGNVLIKEYVDDGYSGTRIDRPALEDLRNDLKTNLFDTVYFLCADRIARQVAHQNMVIGDILKYKKQIIINNKDYIHNPENSFSLTVLGAVAELERAKIIERTTRGKRHRLRQGQIMSHGHSTYGYQYIKKTLTTPPKLVIDPKEGKVVEQIFDMFANQKMGVLAITRWLEKNHILTKTGKKKWLGQTVKTMLENETYAGTRYFNRVTVVKKTSKKIIPTEYKRAVERDRSDWIGVKVPVVVPKETFDKAQRRIRANKDKYRQPNQRQLLSELVECGECGRRYSASRRYVKAKLKIGIERIHHRISYGCNSRATRRMHSKENAEKCTNKTVYSHILEKKVFELLREEAIDHKKLKDHMRFFKQKHHDQVLSVRKIKRLEKQVSDIEEIKFRLVSRHVSGNVSQEDYIQQNHDQDIQLNKFKAKLDKLTTNTSLLHNKNLVDTSIRKFCNGIHSQIDRLNTFDTKRQFLIKHIEKVVYNKYHVTIYGSVPVRHKDKIEKLPFCIKGHIDTTQLHRGPRKQFLVDGRLKEWGAGGRDVEVTKRRKQELQSVKVGESQVTQKVMDVPIRESVGYTIEGRKKLKGVRDEANKVYSKIVSG